MLTHIFTIYVRSTAADLLGPLGPPWAPQGSPGVPFGPHAHGGKRGFKRPEASPHTI